MKLIGKVEGALFYRMNDGSIRVVSVGANWSVKHYVFFVGGLLLTLLSVVGGFVGILILLLNFYIGLVVLGCSVAMFFIANILFSAGLLDSGNITSIQKWCLRNPENPGATLLYNGLKSFEEKQGRG